MDRMAEDGDAAVVRIAAKYGLERDLVALLARSRAGGDTTVQECMRINRFLDGGMSISRFVRLNAELDALCGIDRSAPAVHGASFDPEEAKRHRDALDALIAAQRTANGFGR